MAGSYIVHGERIVDGDASALTVLTLYNSGSVTARTLLATEILHITDVVLSDEENADVQLVADSAAAGRYIVFTKIAAGGSIVIHFNTPYACPKGVVPKFAGGNGQGARSMCIIQGFIREA